MFHLKNVKALYTINLMLERKGFSSSLEVFYIIHLIVEPKT